MIPLVGLEPTTNPCDGTALSKLSYRGIIAHSMLTNIKQIIQLIVLQ